MMLPYACPVEIWLQVVTFMCTRNVILWALLYLVTLLLYPVTVFSQHYGQRTEVRG